MITPSTLAPPSFNQETAVAVLSHYPELAGCSFDWELIKQGQSNDAARITVANQLYLLKKLPLLKDKRHQEFATSVLMTLSQTGFPCPKIMTNALGQGLTENQGQLFVVQSWLEGHHLAEPLRENPPESLVRHLGETIGSLHSTLAMAPLPPVPAKDQIKVRDQVEGLGEFITKIFRGSLWRPSHLWRIRLRPGKTLLDESVISSLLLMQQIVEHLQTWLPAHEESLSQLTPVHGDINWENILLNSNDEVALIDFDNTRMQPPACEVAAALALLGLTEGSGRAEFLSGYSTYGLPVPSPRILNNLIVLKYCRSLAWQISNWYLLKIQKPEMRQWIIYLAEGLKNSWHSLESNDEGSS